MPVQSRDERIDADPTIETIEKKIKGKVVYVADKAKGDFLAKAVLVSRGADTNMIVHLEWKGKDGGLRRDTAPYANIRTLDEVASALKSAATDAVSRENVERTVTDLYAKAKTLVPDTRLLRGTAMAAFGIFMERVNRRKGDDTK
jgi:hypothetical protein